MRTRSVEKLLVVLLLCSGALSAQAGDGERRERDDRYNGGRDGSGAQVREQRQERPEHQRDARPAQQMPPPDQRPEASPDRRSNRMSPEDRRALRRQIDQASHDIYAPNR